MKSWEKRREAVQWIIYSFERGMWLLNYCDAQKIRLVGDQSNRTKAIREAGMISKSEARATRGLKLENSLIALVFKLTHNVIIGK
jgi:hypothetical protein